MAEKNSLWRNIRKKAEQNRRTGATPKKPTKEMLDQERKIKANQKADGGPVGDDGLYNMQRALELGYTPDETGHWPSVDSETGMWLKSKEHPTAWMEYMHGYALNPEVQKQYQHPVVNPEGYFGENQLQYNLKAQGGYVDGDKDKNKKPKTRIYTDPEEFKIAQKNYSDSLDVYNLSLKVAKNKLNLPEIDENTFKSLNEKNNTIDPNKWDFDKVQYEEDNKRNKVKNFKDYMYEIPDFKSGTEEEHKNHYIKLRENSPQYARNYPIKYDTPDKILKLKNGIERHYPTYNGKVLDETWYTDIYSDGTSREYSDGQLFDINTPNIQPIDYKYYGEDKPREYNRYDLTSSSSGWYSSDEKPKFKNTSNESYVDYYIPTWLDKIYKKPEVKPILKKSTSQPRPTLSQLDKLQSKQYTSSNQQPSLVSNIEEISPVKTMSADPEGHYRITRPSTYGEPNYQVWTSGNKWKDVSKEEFDKISSEKYLTEYAQGGKLYPDGGPINPYMYYSGGPMYYGDGGKIWKHIGAGAYGILEGGLDTLTFGATDQLTDKGFNWLTKVGNKNLDLNDPKNAKFLRTQQQIRGYSNVAGAIGTAAFTGQWGSAIGQSAKGVNTAFQATEGLSDDFKKWSNISSQAIGIGAGLAGGSLNSAQSASKIGQAATKFGSQASKVAPYANQAMGMLGNSGQPLWQQAEARQDYLNSPEYLAMKQQQNQAYVNQGLSFAANGGPVNNNLVNLQTGSMRNNINSYRRKYKEGGQVDVNDKLAQFGLRKIQNGGRHWQNPKDGVIVGNASVEEDEVLKFAEGGSANLSNAEYVYPDTVNDEFTLPMYKPNESLTDFELDKDGNPIALDMTPAEFLIKEGTKGSPFRKINTLAKIRMNNAEAITRKARDLGMAINEQNQQNQQMMVEGALQYAAAGGKLNKDLERILIASDDIQSYVEADNYYAYGGYLPKDKGFNMPNSYAKGGSIHIKKSKRGTFTAAAKKRGKSVQEFARQVLANKGNYSAAMVKKANFARNAAGWKHAVGGPLYGNTDSEYTYAHGGPVVSNVPQDFDLYAQNRGGMMMAQGGMMQQQGGQDQMIQLIQAYAQATGVSPEEIIQQLQQMEPQAQQQAIQQMAQELQGGQQQGMARGGNMYAVGGGPGDELDPEQLKAQGYVEYDNYFYNPTTGQYVDKPSEYPSEIDAQFQKNIERFMQPGFQVDNRYFKPLLGLLSGTGIKQMPINTDATLKIGGIKKPGMENIINDESYVEGTQYLEPWIAFQGDSSRNNDQLSSSYNLKYVDPYTLGNNDMMDERFPILDREGNIQTTPEDFAKLQSFGNSGLDSYRNKYFTDTYNQVMSTRDKVRRAYQNKSPYLDNIVNEPAKPNKSNTYLRNLNTPNFVDNQGNTSSILSRRNKNKSTPVQPIGGMQPKNLQQLPTNNTTPGIIGSEEEFTSFSNQPVIEEDLQQLYAPQRILNQSNTSGFIPPIVNANKKAGLESIDLGTFEFNKNGNITNNSSAAPITENIDAPVSKNIPSELGQPLTGSTSMLDWGYEGVNLDGNPVSINPNMINQYEEGWRPEGTTMPENPNMFNNVLNKVGKFATRDNLTSLAQMAGPLHQFFQKKPKPFNYNTASAKTVDPTEAIAIADAKLKQSENVADYNTRQNAPSSGSYLANARANALTFGNKRAVTGAGIKQQYDLNNANILNQFEQYNTELENRAIEAHQQDMANWQEQRTNALYNAGANLAGINKDANYKEMYKNYIAPNIGTNNYEYVQNPDGTYTLIPRQGSNSTFQVTKPETGTPTTNPAAPATPITLKEDATAPQKYTQSLAPGTFNQNDPEQVKGFQDWMDTYHPNWAQGKNLNKAGKGYGRFGPSTKSAYDNYMYEYYGLNPNINQFPI